MYQIFLKSTVGKTINKKTGSNQDETFCRKGEVTLYVVAMRELWKIYRFKNF